MRKKIGKLPPTATALVKYLLGFGVSVAVGLAPYLGRVRVPLFTPMLSLIPQTIQGIAIPLSSASMGIVAVVVQWYGSRQVSKDWSSRVFVRTLIFSIVFLLALVVVEMLAVERIYLPATGETVSFAVGFAYPKRAQCEGLSRAKCIEQKLVLDPDTISSYFGDAQVKIADLLLVLIYTAFMSSF